jgi:transcriptional regulator with XRE-family HTH domain
MFLSVGTDNLMRPTEENTVNHPFENDELDEFIAAQSQDPEFLEALHDAQTRSALRRQLITARKAMKLSQSDVAKCMNTTQSAVSDFENAETDPQLSTFQRYARAVCGQLELVFSPTTVHVHSNIEPTRWNTNVRAHIITSSSVMFIAPIQPDVRTQFESAA